MMSSYFSRRSRRTNRAKSAAPCLAGMASTLSISGLPSTRRRKGSSTTYDIRARGRARLMAATAGVVMTMSPMRRRRMRRMLGEAAGSGLGLALRFNRGLFDEHDRDISVLDPVDAVTAQALQGLLVLGQ